MAIALRRLILLALIPLTLTVVLVWTSSLAQTTKSEDSTNVRSTSVDIPHEYQRWLNEDVHWIITPEERDAFLRISKNEDRDHFIEQFWMRRDSARGNGFKEEHYRRLAYANQHFAAAVPGWKTDRGRIYILYGSPESVYVRQGQGDPTLPPLQVWHYQSISGYGENVDLRFIDVCRCGDYRLLTSPKD